MLVIASIAWQSSIAIPEYSSGIQDMNPETRVCKHCQQSFVIEPDDFGFYEKLGVPPPTLCPPCRLQRRMLFRNERDYYRRKCDLCSASIISVYPAEFKTPVYCVKCWWSDKWDPKRFAREYDLSRSFIEQFQELFYAVPMIAMQNDNGIGSVNCEYTYDFAFGKNCYLVVCDWETENSLYSYHVCQAKEMVDSYNSNHCSFSYELVNCRDCNNCRYGDICISCNDCVLGYDLRGCSDCIMCVGLRNKRYCIRNQQYTKEEYERKKKELKLEDRNEFEKLKKKFEQFSLQFPRRYAHLFKSPGSTGDILYNSKMSRDCFYFQELEDCRYMVQGDGGKETYDCNNTGRPNFCYEGVTPDNSYGNVGTIYCWKCNQAEYSNNCHSSSYVLGCSGLRSAEYCILNKQYSKEEFTKLRDQIIAKMKTAGEWGEFFPASMSPHAYNESPAQDWLPLTESQAVSQGFRWKPKQGKEYPITILPGAVPTTIGVVTDAILQETIGCLHQGLCEQKCTTAFKITPQELQFYRRMNIPLPALCHNCRYYERLKRRNPPRLYDRQCSKCSAAIKTPYAPDRPEIVYCESCYNAEIV